MAADDDEFARWIFFTRCGSGGVRDWLGWVGVYRRRRFDYQETRDFDGVTKTIGPYYLSERAQHIKDEFIVPYDWDDYLQDFESYMDEFCEVSGGDDWTKFTGYAFTPSNGGTRVTSDTFMTEYLTDTITAAKAGTAPADGALEKVEKTVKDMCGIHAVLRYLHWGLH